MYVASGASDLWPAGALCVGILMGGGGGRRILLPHPMIAGGGGRHVMLPHPVMVRTRRRGSVNPSHHHTKKKRVGKITLYHLTSLDAGRKIKRSGKMLRGSQGWFGGGIYFASSVSNCARKSKHGSACVIKAEVNMGVSLVINANSCSTTYTYSKLKSMGCNSIIAKGISTGDEFVVFNYSQVKILSVKDKNGNNI